jgi:putative CocE/NonD family hydrolase
MSGRRKLFAWVAASDGVRLATDVYLPRDAGARVPAIYVQTFYGRSSYHDDEFLDFTNHGYAVVIQDIRGRYASEGDWFTAAVSLTDDGVSTLEWLVRQPWCTGKVGTIGCSFQGEAQLFLARARHPAHAAMIPEAAAHAVRDTYQSRSALFELANVFGWFRQYGHAVRPCLTARLSAEDFQRAEAYWPAIWGGVPTLPEIDELAVLRHLPVLDMMRLASAVPNHFARIVQRHSSGLPDDLFPLLTSDEVLDVPALWIDSWFDYGPAETLELMQRMRDRAPSERARRNQYAIIGPTTHCAHRRAGNPTIVGDRDFGDASLDYFGLYVAWFDHWLKGRSDDVLNRPPVQVYAGGANAWWELESWPPNDVETTRLFLASRGMANSRFGDGRLVAEPLSEHIVDRIVYDPAAPVPTVGGALYKVAPGGPRDQADIESRDDVLVYTSEPLERELQIAGSVEATLYLSSDCPDTDAMVKVCDVDRDGRSTNIVEGGKRVRHRRGREHNDLLSPDEVAEVLVELGATSYVFHPGHRIRIQVSSSSFPRYDRNLNTGGNYLTEKRWRVARNSIHSGGAAASHVRLPVRQPHA